MIYENFNPQIHDVYKVARLVYDVDFRTFNFLFKDKNKAISTIESDLKKFKVNNNFKVILDENNQIIGILETYISKMPHDFRIRPLKLIIVDILDYFVLSDIHDGDLYVAELAVDGRLRGQGLGKKVLCDVIQYAKDNDFNRVILDADFTNTNALRFYEKMGFKEFNKKRVKFLRFERGMHNMEFNL